MDIQDAVRRLVREELAGHQKELERLKKNLKRNLERVAEILGDRYVPYFSDSEEEDNNNADVICIVCNQALDPDAIYYDDRFCSSGCMKRAKNQGLCAECMICNRVHKVGIYEGCVFVK